MTRVWSRTQKERPLGWVFGCLSGCFERGVELVHRCWRVVERDFWVEQKKPKRVSWQVPIAEARGAQKLRRWVKLESNEF